MVHRCVHRIAGCSNHPRHRSPQHETRAHSHPATMHGQQDQGAHHIKVHNVSSLLELLHSIAVRQRQPQLDGHCRRRWMRLLPHTVALCSAALALHLLAQPAAGQRSSHSGRRQRAAADAGFGDQCHPGCRSRAAIGAERGFLPGRGAVSRLHHRARHVQRGSVLWGGWAWGVVGGGRCICLLSMVQGFGYALSMTGVLKGLRRMASAHGPARSAHTLLWGGLFASARGRGRNCAAPFADRT